MNHYTELLTAQAEELSLESEEFEDALLKIATLFRGFGEALTDFMVDHGYCGDLDDAPGKTAFLREQFKASNVTLPRDFKAWFRPDAKISRKTAFQVCFAFNLDVEETNEFFRCVQFERGFDCHTVLEAVYYFCIRNGLSYSEAEEIMKDISVPPKGSSLPGGDLLYTGTIMDCINGISDKEQLVQYITDNIENFKYNNATAIKYIQELWAAIAKPDGLAVQEAHLIDKSDYHTDIWEPEQSVIAGSKASTWTIFSQIIGLADFQEQKYAKEYDRSLGSVLSENKLMPLKADYCFPSRQNIDKLVGGKMVGDDEIIRKMLIFLVFYTYWAKFIICKNGELDLLSAADSERCLATINARLLDSGYPELYAGNPYDWLFLWALHDEKNPLFAFRYYMGEVLIIKEKHTDQ